MYHQLKAIALKRKQPKVKGVVYENYGYSDFLLPPFAKIRQILKYQAPYFTAIKDTDKNKT